MFDERFTQTMRHIRNFFRRLTAPWHIPTKPVVSCMVLHRGNVIMALSDGKIIEMVQDEIDREWQAREVFSVRGMRDV